MLNTIRFWLFAGSLSFLNGCGGDHQSDASLRSTFFQHEESFARLIQMANEDSHVTRIAPDFTMLDTDGTWPRNDIGFSQQRWDEYRTLFRNLRLEKGIWTHAYPGVMPIATDRTKMKRHTLKGFLYASEPLQPVVESLDHQALSVCHGIEACIVYARLKGNWYMFYEVG